MNLHEMRRLQGIADSDLKQVVSDAQFGAMFGNAMSVNVLERICVDFCLPATLGMILLS